jgi:hypothetical protein
MRFIIASTLITAVLSYPVPQMEKNMQGMTNAATSFPKSFLKGDMNKATKDLADMITNAFDFPRAFLSDMTSPAMLASVASNFISSSQIAKRVEMTPKTGVANAKRVKLTFGPWKLNPSNVPFPRKLSFRNSIRY